MRDAGRHLPGKRPLIPPDDSDTKLDPWLEAFQTVFGERPKIAPLAAPPGSGLSDLSQITFPYIFDKPDLVGRCDAFRLVPEGEAMLRGFGYDWDDQQRILSAPTPSTFNQLLPILGRADAGFGIQFYFEDSAAVSTAPWLRCYLEGKIPIHVGSRLFYTRRLAMGKSAPRARELRWHLQALPHDLTVHALNYHLIPHSAIREIASRIREELPERAAAWSQPGATVAPLTLASFYDNDLNRYSYSVWNWVRKPGDFERLFTHRRNYSQLLAALALRIEETRAGKGDVESASTYDMAPLEPYPFKILD